MIELLTRAVEGIRDRDLRGEERETLHALREERLVRLLHGPGPPTWRATRAGAALSVAEGGRSRHLPPWVPS